MRDLVLEHRLYLPLVGYSMFLVSGLYYLFGRKNIPIMVIALSMLVACNSFLTFQRNKVWKDEVTLWNDVVQKSPRKSWGYLNRGYGYFGQGKLDQLLADFNKAIALDPNSFYAYNNRGIVYQKQGRLIKAIIEYTKAIMVMPLYIGAYDNRGTVFKEMGNFSYAIADFTKIIEIDPDYIDAYRERADSYYQLKEYDKSWADVHKAEELGAIIDPNFVLALKKASGRDK